MSDCTICNDGMRLNDGWKCDICGRTNRSSLAGPTGSARTWTVKRVVIEMYSVQARTQAEALDAAATKGDPYSVTIKSETATVSQ